MNLKPIPNQDLNRIQARVEELKDAYANKNKDQASKVVGALKSEIIFLQNQGCDVSDLTDQIGSVLDKYDGTSETNRFRTDTGVSANFAEKKSDKGDSGDKNLGEADTRQKLNNQLDKQSIKDPIKDEPPPVGEVQIDDSGSRPPSQNSRIDFDFILNHKDPAKAIRENDPAFTKALGGDAYLEGMAQVVRSADPKDVSKEAQEFLELARKRKTSIEKIKESPKGGDLRFNEILLRKDRDALTGQDRAWLKKEARKNGFGSKKWQYFDHLSDQAWKVAESSPEIGDVPSDIAMGIKDYLADPEGARDPKKLEAILNAINATGKPTMGKDAAGSRTGNTEKTGDTKKNATTSNRLSEDELKQLNDISPKLARTVGNINLEQAKFDAYAERSSDSIIALIHSGLPIEYILHQVMLRVNALQEQRIRLITMKLAASEDFEREVAATGITKEQKSFLQTVQHKLDIKSKQEITQELKYHTDQAKNTWDTLSRILDLLHSMSKSISEKIGR